jgi:hypothetical protein
MRWSEAPTSRKGVWFPGTVCSSDKNKVWLGSLRVRRGLRRGLLPLPGQNLPQPFSISSHPRAGGLGHLLREFDSVHSHTRRIRPSWFRWSVFLRGGGPASRKGGRSGATGVE